MGSVSSIVFLQYYLSHSTAAKGAVRSEECVMIEMELGCAVFTGDAQFKIVTIVCNKTTIMHTYLCLCNHTNRKTPTSDRLLRIHLSDEWAIRSVHPHPSSSNVCSRLTKTSI